MKALMFLSKEKHTVIEVLDHPEEAICIGEDGVMPMRHVRLPEQRLCCYVPSDKSDKWAQKRAKKFLADLEKGEMESLNPVKNDTDPNDVSAVMAAIGELITEGLTNGDGPATKPAINKIDQESVAQFKYLNEHSGELNSLDRYQEIATGSAIYPGQGTPFGLMYAALGLAEAGEVQNKVKKLFRDDGVIEFTGNDDEGVHHVKFGEITEERRLQIIKELGGALWYISAVCNEIKATMSEVALANLEELASRSERGTLSGSGDNR